MNRLLAALPWTLLCLLPRPMMSQSPAAPGTGAESQQPAQEQTLQTNDLGPFAGTYARFAGSPRPVTISVDGDRLVARSPSGGGELERHDEVTFRFIQGPQELTFVRGENGAETAYDGFRLGRPGASSSGALFRRVELLEAEYRATAGQIRPHALSDAVLMGDLVAAQSLIAAGADARELDNRRGIAGNNGRRPLHWAALTDRSEMIELLLDAGADIDETNVSGFTPLHHAAEANALEAAELLIARDADLEVENTRGQTALAIALRSPGSAVAERIRAAMEAKKCPEGGCPEPSAATSGYTPPPKLDDGLATATLSDVGAREELVYRLLADLESGVYQNVDSLLILEEGKLVVEQYYNGWTVDRAHPMQSVSKSVTGLLFGSALRQGHIESLEEPIGKYLPEQASLLGGDLAEITIEDLLTMSAGFDWNEQDPPYGHPDNVRGHEVSSEDSVQFTLSRPHVNEPGEVFTYSGGYVTVAGAVLVNATGADSVLDYFSESTLTELGLEGLHWFQQRDGRQNTAGGLTLRPRDLAKIGQLMLDGGVWQGERLLDEEFVEASLSKQIEPPGPWNEYGYYWWGRTFETEKGSYAADAALGWGGQELILVPELGLVVVFTATNYQAPTPTATILAHVILPAFE